MMLIPMIGAAVAAITAASMLYDLLYYRLPNYLMLVLLLLYPLYVYAIPEPFSWWWDLTLALVVLGVGVGLYALGVLGAGDVKFSAVAFLWVGVNSAFIYFATFALIGGLMSVLLLFGRPIIAQIVSQEKLIQVLRLRAPVPYGLALGSALLLYLFGII